MNRKSAAAFLGFAAAVVLGFGIASGCGSCWTSFSVGGEKPMAITWELLHQLPGDLYATFAAAVA